MPRKAKKIKNPVGNPPKDIDWAYVDEKLKKGSNGAQIASSIGIHPDTLYDRCETDKRVNWSAYLQQKRSVGDSLLHEAQFNKAINGDSTLLIWLGKNRLEQRDTPQEIAVASETVNQFKEVMQQMRGRQSSADNIDATKNNADEKSV